MSRPNSMAAAMADKPKVRPNERESEVLAFMALLKSCSARRALDEGRQIHAHILKRDLLDRSPYLGSSLISMYAKCGALSKAQEVLEGLPIRNVVSWSALIAGFAGEDQGHEAINCFEQMRNEGLSPDAITFTCILKSCGDIQDIAKGKQIHEKISKMGLLEKDIMLGTALVDMYAKCGMAAKAQNVLERLPLRNAASWNALIAGYAQQGQLNEVLNCYEQMQREGLSPNAITFTCTLNAISCSKAIVMGKKIHEEIISRGLLKDDIVLGNALVDMYAKCGMLVEARRVLNELPFRNVVSWSALIAEYAEHGQHHEALSCFETMQSEGLSPNSVTYICILRVCGRIEAIEQGEEIYKEIVNRGLLKTDIVLGNALIDMYVKCGMLGKAREVLWEIPSRDVVSWSTLIAGFAEHGPYHEALSSLKQMRSEGLIPNAVTFICILKACASLGVADKGKEIHDEIVNRGLLKSDIVLGTALVNMYAKCGMLPQAQKVLEELPDRDAAAWSALITGYIQQGQDVEALNCFKQMKNEGLFPDDVSLLCILKICGNTKDIEKGEEIHDVILSRSLLEKNAVIGTALINMYAKCGRFDKAQKVLEELSIRDVVSWSVLIQEYAQQGKGQEALNCFEQMQNDALSPDSVTFLSILKACGSIGAVDRGAQIHEHITKMGLLKKDLVLGSALVDMYAKCGALRKARQVLEDLPVRNIVTWSALIAGYAQHGLAYEALNCIKHMEMEGHTPDGATVLSGLSACGHSRFLVEAQELYQNMTLKYGIMPTLEHHTCMVVVFAYAGLFDRATLLITMIPYHDYPVIWLTLMGACKKWGNVKLAQLAFDQLVQLDDSCAAAYVLMLTIFTDAGMQGDANKVETMRSSLSLEV